jgi:hypothetical protein
MTPITSREHYFLLLTSYFLLLTSYFLLLKWVMGTLMAQMRADAADSDGC